MFLKLCGLFLVKRVITTEWIDGMPVGDVERIRKSGLDIESFAKRIIKTFLTQALRDGFFMEICTKVILNVEMMVH
ncbi:MAG: hypothetical protein CM15mP98_10700 [Paracoccaceae bacterium]|nr:MAG: hypothetical protein CM15mP98_10700 [Paracoccaceae bacterium]